MCKDSVRARQCEVGAEAGALGASEGVVERYRRAGARECEREQPAEAAAAAAAGGLLAAARGVVRGGLPFGVEDFGDGALLLLGGCVQQVADALGVGVDFGCALDEVA